jgi:hypothetical protein
MALPTQKSQPKSDIRDLVTLIYGAPKIGKSTFCAAADGALFIETEPGLELLEVYKMPVSSWSEFLEAAREIAEGKHEFRTIVIDTIDNLFKFCREHILTKNKLQHESDMEWGKGYDLINQEFHRKLHALANLPYGLIMISHSVEKEVKTRTGTSTKIAPTLPNGARKVVLALADFILYAENEEIRNEKGQVTDYARVLRTKPTTVYEAGDRTGRLPETIKLDYVDFCAELSKATGNGKKAT